MVLVGPPQNLPLFVAHGRVSNDARAVAFGLADGQSRCLFDVVDDQSGIGTLIVPHLHPSLIAQFGEMAAGVKCWIAGVGDDGLAVERDRVALPSAGDLHRIDEDTQGR